MHGAAQPCTLVQGLATATPPLAPSSTRSRPAALRGGCRHSPHARAQYFAHHGVEACLLVLPTCEENKELRLVTAIADGVEAFRINRCGGHGAAVMPRQRTRRKLSAASGCVCSCVVAVHPSGGGAREQAPTATRSATRRQAQHAQHHQPTNTWCRRQEPIIAIGGGVCLDVAGLAANLYRRGTCIIKVRGGALGVPLAGAPASRGAAMRCRGRLCCTQHVPA